MSDVDGGLEFIGALDLHLARGLSSALAAALRCLLFPGSGFFFASYRARVFYVFPIQGAVINVDRST